MIHLETVITPTHSSISSPDRNEVLAIASPQDERTSKGSKVVTAREIKDLVAGVAAADSVQFLPKQYTAGYERPQRSSSGSYSELRKALFSFDSGTHFVTEEVDHYYITFSM